ncbi:hypothetical protein BDA96_01G071500 [Sorghum bicolor]|uniref:Uncharacterized protein n=2 Tax=Sorghum bicolor TaxID=4558 RepID=A0A921RVS3_SORBI|nr:hypothetical protein BDA96_01G071500 [Sorghum bicolor]KXG37437.1 hypothetical protein SORBI_3001G069100 [Sorghum bicolor]
MSTFEFGTGNFSRTLSRSTRLFGIGLFGMPAAGTSGTGGGGSARRRAAWHVLASPIEEQEHHRAWPRRVPRSGSSRWRPCRPVGRGAN